MNAFQKIALVAILLTTLGAADGFAKADKKAPATAATENAVVDKGWAVRCSKPEKGQKDKTCEIFGRLEMQKTSMRMAEFAVGFSKDNKKIANGVIILPLGILLEPGVIMKIDDDGKQVPFKASYCSTG